MSFTTPSSNGPDVEWQAGYSTDTTDTAPATIVPLTRRKGPDSPDAVNQLTITGLTPNTSYKVFVRGVVRDSDWVGILNGSTSAWVTVDGATSQSIVIGNGGTKSIDLSSDTGGGASGQSSVQSQNTATWSAVITTWHTPSGTCRSGALNERARNKLTGSFNGDVLTLTADSSGSYILMLDASAEIDGEQVSHTYKVEVGDVDENTPDVSELCNTQDEPEATPTPDPEPTPAPAPEPTAAPNPEPTSTPDPGPGLSDPFDDLEMSSGDTEALDMASHFSGDGLTYDVQVTTTHQRTGKVKTGPLNSVARNKVRGAWNGSVLTLTAGSATSQELTLTVKATDGNGGSVSDAFTLTLDN